MMTFIFCLLLLAQPPTAFPPDDEGDDTRDDPAPVAVHARPSVSNFAVGPMTAQPFLVWANVGYGSVDQYFDDEGENRDLGVFDPDGGGPAPSVDTNAELASIVVHLGGGYGVYQGDDRSLQVGADLGIVRRTLTSDAVGNLPATDASSGFSPQNLTLFSEFSAPTYSVRAGYLLDLGPEDDPTDPEEYTNTDEQDALQLGLSGQYPAESYRVYGGVDYFYTLKSEGAFPGITGTLDVLEYDEGNVLNLHAGGALRFAESFELGLTLLYRINTEGHVGNTDGDELPASSSLGAPNEVAAGSAIGAVPHVSYTAEESLFGGGAPARVFVKGALQREYDDYGYTLSGNDDIAPTLGVTVGITTGI